MPIGKQVANLVQTKLALADKYERRAKVTKSRPKKQVLLNRVARYRKHAEQIARQLADTPDA